MKPRARFRARYQTALAEAEGSQTALRLTTDLRLGLEGRRAEARTTLREGETAFAALSWSTRAVFSSSQPMSVSESRFGVAIT